MWGCNICLVEPRTSLPGVEVYTQRTAGRSYPPPKHEYRRSAPENATGRTYYTQIDPPQGLLFFQRAITDDRSIDENHGGGRNATL